MDPSLTLPSNNDVFQPQPQTQTQHPSIKHPPYSEMISAAITALNEPEGSSMTAISKHIQRFNTDLPLAHRALLFRHLKTLNNSGFLAMVKNSYKLASPPPPPPESLAVAATAASDLEDLRSEIHDLSLDTVAIPSSATQPQKRVRGRPPKPKPKPQAPGSEQYGPDVTKPVKEAHKSEQYELDVTKPVQEAPESEQYGPDVTKPVEEAPEPKQYEPDVAKPVEEVLELEQYEPDVAKPVEEVLELVKRRPGRPRNNGAAPTVQPSVMSEVMKRRGRPPGPLAVGTQRKPTSVSSSSNASVFPCDGDGVRRRGRSKKVDSSDTVVSQGNEETVAVATGMKRGRGRPKQVDSNEIVLAPEGGEIVAVVPGMKRGRGRPKKKVDSGEIVVAQAGGEIVAVATGMKRGRGRPKRVDSSDIVVAPECGEMAAVATGMKRGRGRPPKNKIGVVSSKLVKPKRGRPRKALVITGATGTQDSGYEEMKRMLDHCQEKAKDIANMLKTGVTSKDQVVVQAIQELEWLIAMKANEPPPQAMEEVEPEEVALLLTETEGEEHRQET